MLSVLFALPAAVSSHGQQPVPSPPSMMHSKIFPSGSLPEAKTPAEYQAYAKAAEVEGLDAADQAAERFAFDYPGSELRYLLYSRLMRMNHDANNSAGVLKNGRKVLAITPNDPVALVMISTELAEHTSNDNPDREARFNEALEKARRAINNIDTGLIVPPKTPQVKILQAKNFLLSAAHSSIGQIALLRGQDAEAERELQMSLETGRADPNPLTWLRLALAQEREKNYVAALASADRALQVSQNNTEVQTLARQERERLLHLRGTEEPPQTSSGK